MTKIQKLIIDLRSLGVENDIVNCNTTNWLLGFDYPDHSLNKHMLAKFGSKKNLVKIIKMKYNI